MQSLLLVEEAHRGSPAAARSLGACLVTVVVDDDDDDADVPAESLKLAKKAVKQKEL